MTDDDKINDYIFYKITCLDASKNLLYIGSTTNFYNRQNQHINHINNWVSKKTYNLKLYKTIRDNGGWKNFIMEVLEKRKQLTETEVTSIEQEYIVVLGANMN